MYVCNVARVLLRQQLGLKRAIKQLMRQTGQTPISSLLLSSQQASTVKPAESKPLLGLTRLGLACTLHGRMHSSMTSFTMTSLYAWAGAQWLQELVQDSKYAQADPISIIGKVAGCQMFRIRQICTILELYLRRSELCCEGDSNSAPRQVGLCSMAWCIL